MYVGIDIGGTKTLVASFNYGGKIVKEVKFPTPSKYSEFKIELQKQAVDFGQVKFRGGAIGVRGNIDRERGLAVLDDVLAWHNAPVRDDCSEIFGCSFVLENDSKAAGFGEALYAGKEFSKVLYLTISTGIGSAFVVNGTIDSDTSNSEIGKSIFEHEGRFQEWENFASGKAIMEKYGKRASEIDDPAVWKEISYTLAPGIIDAFAAYTPDLIIIGGGVGAHFEKFQNQLEETIQELLPRELKTPKLQKTAHPEQEVIYGCYELAKQASRS